MLRAGTIYYLTLATTVLLDTRILGTKLGVN